MGIKNYRSVGTFRMGKKYHPFTKEIRATDEKQVRELIFTHFGSCHGLKRNLVKIEKIDEIKDDKVEDIFLKQLIQAREQIE